MWLRHSLIARAASRKFELAHLEQVPTVRLLPTWCSIWPRLAFGPKLSRQQIAAASLRSDGMLTAYRRTTSSPIVPQRPLGSSERVKRQRHFRAACSVGKCPRARIARGAGVDRLDGDRAADDPPSLGTGRPIRR